MGYRYGSHSHTAFQIEYHFMGATKYRYKVLRGEVAELVRETCDAFEIRIVKGMVSCPPSMAPSEIMRRIKG